MSHVLLIIQPINHNNIQIYRKTIVPKLEYTMFTIQFAGHVSIECKIVDKTKRYAKN